MTLTEFEQKIKEEREEQLRYQDCLKLLIEFRKKSQDEIKAELLEIWSTWQQGEKQRFCEMAGLTVRQVHSAVSTGHNVTFELYARVKSVGKDYFVFDDKRNLTEQEKRRLAYLKKRIKERKAEDDWIEPNA